MRITPADLIDRIVFGDACAYSSETEMWDEKFEELISEYGDLSTFARRIESGDFFEVPVIMHCEYWDEGTIDEIILADGHHRFLAAWLLNISMIVKFTCEVTGCEGNCSKILC